MKNRIDIYHIYWGTAGNAGLYLDEIYKVLEEGGYKQKAFVNYYYPFPYGEKVFFKYGDIGNSKLSARKRRLVQFLEILYGFSIALFSSIFVRPRIINYSHVANSYFFIRVYLKILKLVSGAKLVITCHDVNCHLADNEIRARKSIFTNANYLLVHTKRSIKELVEVFDINESKILYHPFPIMDLNKIPPNVVKRFPQSDFLFIGHLRKDKGIEFLLSSWRTFHEINSSATLRICGKEGPGISINTTKYDALNIDFHLGFVSDDDYYSYIKSTRYVILPYLEGTNSGIVSTVLSLGADVITSDLPMFSESPLIPKENLFKTNNTDSLVNLLMEKMKTTPCTDNTINHYREDFKEKVNSVYNFLMI